MAKKKKIEVPVEESVEQPTSEPKPEGHRDVGKPERGEEDRQ